MSEYTVMKPGNFKVADSRVLFLQVYRDLKKSIFQRLFVASAVSLRDRIEMLIETTGNITNKR